MKPWERLRAFAREHGADLVPVDTHQLHEKIFAHKELANGMYIQYAPFTKNLALEWEKKKVFIADEYIRHRYVVGSAIHELGHVLACKERPVQAMEESFLGWEWQVAKRCGLRKQFRRAMDDYSTPAGTMFRHLSVMEKMGYLRASVVRGREYGNINEAGEPLAVR